MKTIAHTFAGLFALALLPASGCAWRDELGLEFHQLEHEGRMREYYVKPLPEGRRPRGIVLVLHGGGGRAKGQARMAAGKQLAAMAARDGYLAVFPGGIEKRWNDGRVDAGLAKRSRAHREGVDDVGFLTRVVGRLEAEHAIPPGNVFVCGISNGGRMTLRLILDRPDVFRAAGVVAMSLDEELWARYQPGTRPVPVAFLHGTEDPLVPYDGGEITVFRTRNGKVRGAPWSAARFAEAYGCTDEAVEQVPDREPGDGTRTERRRYLGCREGAEVVLDTHVGGGHTWPGGTQYLPEFLVGRTVRDYLGTEMLWDFWGRHGLVAEEAR